MKTAVAYVALNQAALENRKHKERKSTGKSSVIKRYVNKTCDWMYTMTLLALGKYVIITVPTINNYAVVQKHRNQPTVTLFNLVFKKQVDGLGQDYSVSSCILEKDQSASRSWSPVATKTHAAASQFVRCQGRLREWVENNVHWASSFCLDGCQETHFLSYLGSWAPGCFVNQITSVPYICKLWSLVFKFLLSGGVDDTH